jgi:hypothetical protein
VHLLPVLVEGHCPQVLPEAAEAVHVALALPPPVDELDAQLEGGPRLADELVLVELKHLVVELDHRDGGLAHTHRTDLVRFDQPQPDLAAQDLGQRGRGHPARRATTGDHDGLYELLVHAVSMRKSPCGRTGRGCGIGPCRQSL